MVGVDFTAIGDFSCLDHRTANKRSSPYTVRLPHDVIHLIVRRFFRCNADVFPEWNYGDYATRNAHRRQQKLIPLAAVNSSWRQTVIPFLYMSVICEETDMPPCAAYAADEYRHCYWRTNLQLFDCSTTMWARRIHILSSRNGSNMESLVLALARQGFSHFPWPHLSSLHLAIVTSTFKYNTNSPASTLIHQSKLAKDPIVLPIHGADFSGIPGICNYIWGVINHAQLDNELPFEGGQVLALNNELGHPAHSSIQRVSLGFAIATELDPTMAIQISRLKIHYYDALVGLLSQLSPALYDLGITDIPQSGISDILYLGHVVPGIKSLCLGFADNGAPRQSELIGPESGIQPQSHRPLSRLCQLRIRNYPHDVFSCLVSLVQHCQCLDYVYIETQRISTIDRLDLCAMGIRVRSFSLACIGNMHTPKERAERVISRVLSESSACFEYLRIAVSLQYGVKLAVPDRSLLLLPRLRSLSLRVPISLDRLAAVVAEMPRLRLLKAPYISTTAIANDAPQSIEELWQFMRRPGLSSSVISTSLERVAFGFWDYQYNTRQLCCMILGFAARIPSILTLVHDPGFVPTLKWTSSCLCMLADSIGHLFGGIPDHIRNLTIADNQGSVSKI